MKLMFNPLTVYRAFIIYRLYDCLFFFRHSLQNLWIPFYTINNIPGFLNVFPLDVSAKMLLNHCGSLMLDPSSFHCLFAQIFRVGILKRIRQKEILLFLNARTQQWDLLLELIVNIWVKDRFLNNVTYFCLWLQFLARWFALVRLRLSMRWWWRWVF